MYRYTLAALLFLPLLMAATTPATYRFADESRIWVEGTSTVHEWDCQVKRFLGRVNAQADTGRMATLTSASVTVAGRSIDCDNGTMNGKLRDALGDDAVRYQLTSATPALAGADGWFSVETVGRLTIAGTTRPARLSMRGKALSGGRFRFTGAYGLHMTDFGVDPPTALLGTLKTGDAVTVRFEVIVEPS